MLSSMVKIFGFRSNFGNLETSTLGKFGWNAKETTLIQTGKWWHDFSHHITYLQKEIII
jgi:hypothetical protein